MSTKAATQPNSAKVVPMATKKDSISALLQQNSSDSLQFAGTENALYERHLIFDRAIDPKVASARNASYLSRTLCVTS